MSHTLERKACVPLQGRSGVLGDLDQFLVFFLIFK